MSTSLPSLSLLLFLAGFVGIAVYGAKAIQVAVGAKARQAYLEETAQDYTVVSAINRFFADIPNPGNTLLFIRHTYYLQIPSMAIQQILSKSIPA